MVLSIIAYSLSASAARCWNTRLPHAGLGPAAEAGVDLDPTAEPLWQIAPGDARPIAVEHGRDKRPVVLGSYPHIPNPPRQQIADPRPLIIPQAVASHRSAPHR